MTLSEGVADRPGDNFLSGGGEMGLVMRSHDWSSTALGPPSTWSKPLRTAVRLILNTGHPMYIWWGPDLLCLYNDAYSRSIGPDRHPGSLGQPGREVWAEIWPIIGPMVDQVIAGEGAIWRENDLVPITRYGERENVYWTYSYSPIDDEDSETGIGGVLVVCAETTQAVIAQRVAEERSKTNEDRYRALFRTIEAGFCIFDMLFDADARAVDYRFVEVNPAFEEQTGLLNAAGHTARELVPTLEQHWFDLYGKVASTGEPARFESGSDTMGRWFDVYAFRIDNPDQRRVAVLFNDVTDRRKAEQALHHTQDELRALNLTLEERIEARTEELLKTEETLRQSQKLEAVGQLTGGVAHDFNNLLTVIRGSVDLLRRPDVKEDRRLRYLDAIADTADRATKLTNQLLAFARRQSLKPERFDAVKSIRVVRDMMGTLVGARIGIDLELRMEPCFIEADRSQFDTAIVNIAVNARDAMAGEGQMTIKVDAVSGIPPNRAHPFVPGEFATVAVTDTGMGIPEDRLSRIFEPFFTTKGVGEGTGLGLSQVFGFVKQSGGDIRVVSRLGEGTTFTLYLPLASAPDEAIDLPSHVEPASAGDGACILVVEDNAEVGTFATQALAELGYKTVFATNAKNALEALASCADPFDAVFTDVVMPGMSGIDLGRQIHRLYPDLPVILTSGYSSILAQNGAHEFELLRKPYSIEELAKMLRSVAKTRQHH